MGQLALNRPVGARPEALWAGRGTRGQSVKRQRGPTAYLCSGYRGHRVHCDSCNGVSGTLAGAPAWMTPTCLQAGFRRRFLVLTRGGRGCVRPHRRGSGQLSPSRKQEPEEAGGSLEEEQKEGKGTGKGGI